MRPKKLSRLNSVAFSTSFFQRGQLARLPTHTKGMDQSLGIHWRNYLMDDVYTLPQVMPIWGTRS